MATSPYRSDLHDFTVVLVHQTEKAVLVDHGGDKPVWIPKSWCEVEVTDPVRKTATLTMSESRAIEKGLL